MTKTGLFLARAILLLTGNREYANMIPYLPRIRERRALFLADPAEVSASQVLGFEHWMAWKDDPHGV
jgi:hypothetical protein